MRLSFPVGTLKEVPKEAFLDGRLEVLGGSSLHCPSTLSSVLVKVLVLLFAEEVHKSTKCLPVPIAYLAHVQLANGGLLLIFV